MALPPHSIDERLRDLRATPIANLPTLGRRIRYLFWGAFCLAFAFVAAYAAVTEQPKDWVVAVFFLLCAAGWVASARKPPEPDQLDGAGEEALQGAASFALSGSGGLVETALGSVVIRFTTRLWRLLKPRRLARWQPAIVAELQPGERRVVSCSAWHAPHGWRRALLWLTFGLAWPWLASFGMVTVTDRRLLFHRSLRRRLRVSAPLSDLEVLQWYQGTHSEARQRVLVLRHGSRVVRLKFSQVWDEEAQWVFDVVASFSVRPPGFVAARWVRWEQRANRDLERQLGQAAGPAAAAVA